MSRSPLRTRNIALLAAALTAASLSASPLYAQAPSASANSGYLDFVGATSGAPSAGGFATGPYRARFGPTSTTLNANAFDVYCFDWLGRAGDSHVRILTFSEAVTSTNAVPTALRLKFAADRGGTAGGLTTGKLNSAAWLTTQMTTANQSKWNEMHVALWRLFWDAGVGYTPLPNLTFQQGTGDQNAQHWFALADQKSNFNASNFRVLAPVNEQGVFRTDRQVFMAQVVPEPGSFALTGLGLVALGWASRRRRSTA